jgi:hypothetical protein
VWFRRQLDRAQLLKANETWQRLTEDSTGLGPLTLNAVEASDWYNVTKAELLARRVQPIQGWREYSPLRRYSLLSVLKLVLQKYGRAARFTQHERERTARRRVSTQQRERAARRQAVDAALATEGLHAVWGPEKDPKQSWFCQWAEFEWLKDGGWRRKLKSSYWREQGSPELHRALLALGMACVGSCGFGGCYLQSDEDAEEGMEKQSS